MIHSALEMGAEDHDEGRQQPHTRSESLAAKEHQAQETALEEKGEDALGRQQAAEDVAHEA